jgi:hypothetical protein
MILRRFRIGRIGFSLAIHYDFAGDFSSFEKYKSTKKSPIIINLHEGREIKKKLKLTKNNKEVISKENIYENDFSIRTDLFEGRYDMKGTFTVHIYKPWSKNFNVLRNSIRLCIGIHILMHKLGVLLHSSSIVDRFGSYIFIGLPNSGKSTIARFAKETGVHTQGDEFILITRENGEFYSYSTPFGGNIEPDKKKAKIKRLFLLKKGKNYYTSKISIGISILSILQNELVCMGTEICGMKLKSHAFQFITEMNRSIGCEQLTFPKRKEFLLDLLK